MLSIIRKNQHFLTFVIVVLTIISFLWLYNRTNLSQIGVNDVAIVYGRVIQKSECEREIRDYRLAIALGLTEFVNDLGGFAENEDVALTSYIFNTLVIQHEASLLNIVPTDENVATVIQKLPIFQTDGAFDSSKYALFMREQLTPRGFTERHLEEVVCDSIFFKRLYQLITAPVVVSESQVREAARIYQPVVAQALYFDRDHYLKNLKKEAVTPEEKREFYEKNKSLFVNEEERVVSYIHLTLPLNQQNLQGKERVKAMQQLSETASTFKQHAQEEEQNGNDFAKSATQYGFKVVTTASFKKKGPETIVSEKTKQPPSELVAAAFKLSNVGTISEIIQSGDNFYIFSLRQITPARPLTFSEVDSKVDKILREQKASQAVQEASNKAIKSLHEAMKAGKTFDQASASLGFKPVTISGSMSLPSSKLSLPEQQCLASTLSLKEGEISEVHHAAWGDFVVTLQKREALNDSDWQRYHASIEERLLDQERHLLFSEWLRQARVSAKISMIDGHHRRSLFSSIFGK
ncbi:MAG: peptidyl-prolyl cis-trans isomerase [Chthoniobacterales bacterium]|nr:peptidyl-prolyl cis-trans isomerase [Chthoniobacterales bacterium]